MMKTETAFKIVARQYAACESVRETARKLGLSQYAVSRALVSQGIAFSQKSRDVLDLRNAGYSDDVIRERLHITQSAISKYSPYRKCSYVFSQKTENALRIIKCRLKKQRAPFELESPPASRHPSRRGSAVRQHPKSDPES